MNSSDNLSIENGKLSNELSSTINILKFVLIFLVFSQHLNIGVTYTEVALRASLLFENFVACVARVAVPVFFFISGMLFFKDAFDYKKKLNNRIKSLFIPYCAWCGIAFFLYLLSYFLGYSSAPFALSNMSLFESSLSIFGIRNLFPRFDFPLWYLRNLFVCCLISPLLLIFVKKIPYIYFCILLLLYLFLPTYNTPFGHIINTTIYSLLFFPLGGYFSLYIKSIRFKYIHFFCICLVFCYTFNCLVGESMKYISYILSKIALLCSFALLFYVSFLISKRVKCPKIISNSIFFVYALHALFPLKISTTILAKLSFLDNEYTHLFLILLYMILIFLISLLPFLVLKKFCPKFLKIINGR